MRSLQATLPGLSEALTGHEAFLLEAAVLGGDGRYNESKEKACSAGNPGCSFKVARARLDCRPGPRSYVASG